MNYIPWVEKYKPNSFESFKNSNILLSQLEKNIKNINHTIIYGEPGIGKTSFIHFLAKKLYSKEDFYNCVLSLNASDERGINTVRKKIKTFAKKLTVKKYDYKIIILDEADTLTYEAQTALRRIIEQYSKITRFFFICNYENKIINPIKSRCNMLKFNKFTKDYVKKFLLTILKKENLTKDYYNNYIDIILDITNQDIRKSIIYLETLVKINNKLDKQFIYDIFGILNTNILKEKLKEIKNISDIKEKLHLFNHYSLEDIINNFLEIIVNDNNMNEQKKYKFIIFLSELDYIKNKNIDNDIIISKLLMEYLEKY